MERARRIKNFQLLILVLLSVIVVQGATFALFESHEKPVDTRAFPQYKLQQEFNFTFEADELINTLLGAFADVLWDIDGSSGFDGIFPVIFSFIPGLGANGDVFVVPIFILSFTGGAIYIKKRWQG